MKRTYTIPLRRKYRNTQRNMRAKKAISVTQQLLRKHMKSEEVKLGGALNDFIWSKGIKNPPGKVTVVCEKNDQGVVYADLEGETLPTTTEEKSKKPADKEAPAQQEKKEESSEVALEEVKGLGPTRIKALKAAGIKNAHELANSSVEELIKVEGVGESTAQNILEAAKEATN